MLTLSVSLSLSISGSLSGEPIISMSSWGTVAEYIDPRRSACWSSGWLGNGLASVSGACAFYSMK